MTFEGGPDPNLSPNRHHQHHVLDWLEDSVSFLSSFLDDSYAGNTADQITSCEWWTQEEDQANMIHNPLVSTLATSNNSPLLPQAEFSKKRKLSTNPTTPNKTPAHQSRQRIAIEGDGGFEEEGEANKKPAATGRKGQGKGNAGSSSNGVSKEVRWAEELLNPCRHRSSKHLEGPTLVLRPPRATIILRRCQSPARGPRPARPLQPSLCCWDRHPRPRWHLHRHLRHDGTEALPVSDYQVPRGQPLVRVPTALTNASILQTMTLDPSRHARSLHVVDIGVSHGVQWPTLLDALARRPGGAPKLVRLAAAAGAAPPGPFSMAPPGYDFQSHLLRYARSIDLNLRIDHTEDLGAGSVALAVGETLVVCVQFRAGHGSADDRTAFLRSIRELEPDLVVLSEIDGGGGEVGFPAGFARNAELLWRFLDSTSAAFKGRDSAERRVMEGEAARFLETTAEAAAAEGRDLWRERMAAVGFREEAFGEEALDAGRALLRKYDGNWEMRPAPAEARWGCGGRGIQCRSVPCGSLTGETKKISAVMNKRSYRDRPIGDLLARKMERAVSTLEGR
ncbi:GRAS domain family [Musa troglodytarum]|uniref:GRAS domain family n=1 Tax=Musa troglodytarum TaxID=320322 RepID=A0A9E7I3X6_9LILI|nr:GRAS domain family [Musa troglodytarum]